VPRLSYHARRLPPPDVGENNNNMTIRRIYNKAEYLYVHERCMFCSQPTNLIIYSHGLYRRKLIAEVAQRQREEKNGHTRPAPPPSFS